MRRDAASDPKGPLKPPAVIPDSTPSIPRRGALQGLDRDLWVALAVLDRVFGADQVTVLRIIPGSRP